MAKHTAYKPVSNFDINNDTWDSLTDLTNAIEDILNISSYTKDMPLLNLHHTHFLFSYGTLRQGFANHGILGKDPRCFGVGFTKSNNFVLVKYTTYPIAFYSADEKFKAKIYGELFEVSPDQLRIIDNLESNGEVYQRIPLEIDFIDKNLDKKTCKAWTYLGEKRFWSSEKDHLKPIPICKPRNGADPYYLFY